tara:strand:- start:211 stop:549 length:339 start_codon:yes stop_codon:yes gene_type:complete
MKTKSKKQIPWFRGRTKKKLKLVSLEEYKKIKVPKNKIPKGYVNRSLFKELYCQHELGIIVRYKKHEYDFKDLSNIERKAYLEACEKYNDYGELNDKKLWQRENEKLMREKE